MNKVQNEFVRIFHEGKSHLEILLHHFKKNVFFNQTELTFFDGCDGKPVFFVKEETGPRKKCLGTDETQNIIAPAFSFKRDLGQPFVKRHYMRFWGASFHNGFTRIKDYFNAVSFNFVDLIPVQETKNRRILRAVCASQCFMKFHVLSYLKHQQIIMQMRLTYVNLISCKYMKKNANLFCFIDPYHFIKNK